MENMKSYLGPDGFFLKRNGQIDHSMLMFTPKGRILQERLDELTLELIMEPSIYDQIFTKEKYMGNTISGDGPIKISC